jgi:hypothetical protein
VRGAAGSLMGGLKIDDLKIDDLKIGVWLTVRKSSG